MAQKDKKKKRSKKVYHDSASRMAYELNKQLQQEAGSKGKAISELPEELQQHLQRGLAASSHYSNFDLSHAKVRVVREKLDNDAPAQPIEPKAKATSKSRNSDGTFKKSYVITEQATIDDLKKCETVAQLREEMLKVDAKRELTGDSLLLEQYFVQKREQLYPSWQFLLDLYPREVHNDINIALIWLFLGFSRIEESTSMMLELLPTPYQEYRAKQEQVKFHAQAVHDYLPFLNKLVKASHSQDPDYKLMAQDELSSLQKEIGPFVTPQALAENPHHIRFMEAMTKLVLLITMFIVYQLDYNNDVLEDSVHSIRNWVNYLKLLLKYQNGADEEKRELWPEIKEGLLLWEMAPEEEMLDSWDDLEDTWKYFSFKPMTRNKRWRHVWEIYTTLGAQQTFFYLLCDTVKKDIFDILRQASKGKPYDINKVDQMHDSFCQSIIEMGEIAKYPRLTSMCKQLKELLYSTGRQIPDL